MYKELDLITNTTSTQILGEHARVFEILSKETTTFAFGDNVFVIKFVVFERDIKIQKSDS